jgi:hypothetical protein
MAEQKVAGPEKKGFFAKRAERKEAEKAAAQAPPKIPTAPLKPGAPPARPAAPLPPRPAAAPPPRPAPPPPEIRVSLESLPEVEKRIDRMSATERRQSLLERYEKKYGEQLDMPKVFVSIEDEKKAGAAAAADAMAGGPAAIDEGKLATVTGMAPPRPAAPPPKAPAPARTGFFGAKPAALAPARPVAQAPARPAGGIPARPVAPVEAAPVQAQPGIPVYYTAKAFWKYLWNPTRFPMRAIAKLKFPGDRSKLNMYTVADAGIWALLLIPRFLVLLWAGLIVAAVNKYVFKKKQPGAPEAKPAATD